MRSKTVEELINDIKRNHFKIATVKGFIFSNPLINDFLSDPNYQPWIIKTHTDFECIDLLINGEVDAFVADRIVGSTLIWQANFRKHIVEYRLDHKAPTYVIFSKKSVSPEVVERFNTGIQKIMDSEVYKNIVTWYLYPAIVFQIRDALWFKIIEIIGTIAFAISGLVIAYRERATLFGAVILALLPSIGGGLIRDLVLERNPVGALQSPIYLLTVLSTVAIGYLMIRILKMYRSHHTVPSQIEMMFMRHIAIILTITDAIGLAAFTVIGVLVSLLAKANPLWLWGPFFAFVTGAGGGILRDLVSHTRYIQALEGEFYGELAIIWGFLLSVFILLSTNQAEPEYLLYAVIFTILGVFISRIVIHFIRFPNIHLKIEEKKP